MKNRFFFFSFLIITLTGSLTAQEFNQISAWDESVNNRLESFLEGTRIIKERKVAVFDCDGTLLGQSPYYLADEALYNYAKEEFSEKKDSISLAKMAVIDSLLHGNNVGMDYVQRRISFLSGLSTTAVENIGEEMFHEKYEKKFYPEMKQLLANLEDYGFEIWVVTASPEILYQQFVSNNMGIPMNRIIGVKSVIHEGKITGMLVQPVPQDEGKANAIQTFIKAKPLFVAGNSRGDLEMMNESVGLKMIVNPDDSNKMNSEKDESLNGHTLKQYWQDHEAIIVTCKDISEGDYEYVSEELEIKRNTEHQKVE
ncbi:haloacid dehalogenase-like hydrolase [Gramella sp. AN32]|uniref:phosphoserine phosphatase n=1 Tax=Christiangramia antarctica TaxID=2058158 RepID=A0ABW5X1U1_9FLAO|nr:haloacid dehalogenase-like hydrolase [Gramella sp. AN32]MCM4155704.1 haloacid dehalogenase-like hydrolase [Gramella sp. AN32]